MRTLAKLEPFNGRRCCLLLTTCAMSAAFAGEAEVAPSPVRLSGFATLGLTHNDNSDVGMIFSSSQKRPAAQGVSANLDSVLGLQMDWQLLPNTSVVVQGVARAGENFEPKLRLAYVRQQLGADTAVRVGRMRSPLFFDSDVAEIGYAYLLSRAPVSVYGSMNNVSHLDGGDVQWRHSLGNIAFLLQGYYGSDRYKHHFYNTTPVEEADVALSDIGGIALSAALPNLTLRVSHTATGGYTMRSPQISQLNAGVAQVSAALSGVAANPMLPAAMAQALAAQAQKISGYTNLFDAKPSYTSIGFDSNLDAWRVLGEWTRLDTQAALTGKYEGYHLSLGYAVGAFTPYISYARQTRISPTLDTSALAATGMNPMLDGAIAQLKGAVDQSVQFTDISMHSSSIGLRWDFRENMALKLQYDRLETPSSNTAGFLALTSLPFNNKVNLFTVALDIAF